MNIISIMEFRDDKVTRETLYFADPLDPPEWRSEWVEVGPGVTPECQAFTNCA